MTTNTQQAKSQQSGGVSRPVTARVMRGLSLLVLAVFVAVSVVAVVILRGNQQQDIRLLQQVSLNEGRTRLEGLLNGQRAALSQVAASPSATDFALETVATANQDIEALQAAQSGLVTQLNDLLTRERGTVLAARYIMRTGSVWTALTWENGLVVVDDDFNLGVLDPDTAPQLTTARLTEAGAVAIASFRVETALDGTIQPVMTLVTPIARPNDLNSILGVLELQVDATRLLTSLNEIAIGVDTNLGQRLLIVDEAGQFLADTDETGLNYLLETAITNDDVALLDALRATPGTVENQSLPGTFGTRQFAAAPLTDLTGAGVSWRLVVVTDAAAILGETVRNAVVFVMLNALAAGLLLWYANRSLSENLGPMNTVGELIRQMAGDAADAPAGAAPASPRKAASAPPPPDEDEVYAATQQIAARLQQLNAQIDAQTERYNRNLKVAARISRETALLRNLDDLLNRSIDMIATSFNIYHAQVFLVDEAKVNAVLRYSRGEAGQKLLAHGHKLPVGSKSVIGRVTATGQPVIVNDTHIAGQTGQHFANPLLPNTRAEMALPLQIGDDILGALDLQSELPDAFRDEDQQTYQLIADQIAIAIYKTRLLRESEARIERIEKLNLQLTQMAWAELEREVGLDHAYRYNLLEVEPGGIEETQEITRTAELMAIPIRIRGEVIGTMHAAPPEGMAFTEGDYSILSSVAERVALAVENARLFQETQSNLAETSTLYETTRALNEAESLRDIIQAIISAAMPDAISGQIVVFEDPLSQSVSAFMQVIASWTDPAYAGAPGQVSDLVGRRLEVAAHPILRQLSGDSITLVQDTLRDKRLSDDLRHLFWSIGARAVVFIPLTVRGNWRGFAQMSFPDPREFSEREGRIYTNLVDQAGVAIDNRLLLQQTEDALSQNERLYAGSRMINQAIGLEDLVRAAVVTSDLRDLNFGLALFEGDIDRSGWSRRVRHVAQSHDGIIRDPNRSYDIIVDDTSPMREREPEVIEQQRAATSPMQQALLRIFAANGDTYGTVFPLFSANQPIALFFASRQQAQPLTAEDMEIYRALTGMMSTVIQNRNLLDQMGEALDETRRLYDASRGITAAQDMESIYSAAVRHLTAANNKLSRVNVFLAGPEPSTDAAYLDVAYSWVAEESRAEPLPPFARLDTNSAPFGQMTADRGTALFYIRDIFNDLADYPRLCHFFEAGDAQNVLICALNPRQQWLGVMTLESHQHNAFDDAYQRFVDALGDQVAIALENQMLFQRSQQEARQALALAEASSLANQIGVGLTEAIDTMFVRVAETAGYDRWLLMLLDGNTLNVVTQSSPDPDLPLMTGRLNLSTAEHTLADAVRFNRTMVVNDPLNEAAFRDRPGIAGIVGKHIATPVIAGETVVGALMIGRGLNDADMADRDEILISTMAAQVAVSVENQRLFERAETERGTLRSILDTLPAGVLVLDAETLIPLQSNAPVAEYLGRPLDETQPFTAQLYNIYRTGTNLHYPAEELPIMVAKATGTAVLADDLSVITDAGPVSDLLMNAAPIRNSAGEITNIVVALEDISNLRGLENTLQDNLRETISLYEATRALTSAEELTDVLDVVTFQLSMLEPGNAHLILRDQFTMEIAVERSLYEPLNARELPRSVLLGNALFVSNDVAYEDSLTEPDRERLILLGIQAMISIPLTASRRTAPLGWLMVTHEVPHTFTPEDERFISTLGDNAAVAIDNRYLFESTQEALRETSLLYSATRSISRAQTMEELAKVVQEALIALNPDAYAAYLMTDPSSPDDITELFNAYDDGAPLRFEPLLTTYGLFRDENIYIEDLANLEDPTPFEQALQRFGVIRALASVSLRVKGMPDGRLFLAYNQPKSFHEGDTRYLNAVADSASVIIYNVLLLRQIQQTLEETSTLYQSSRAVANATKPEDILDVVVKWLVGAHVTQVFVALLGNRTWDDPNAAVEVVASWQRGSGIDLQGVSLTAEQFPAWSLMATPDVVTVDDVEHATDINPLEQMGIESLDTRSLAIIPLRVPSRPIGMVWIGSTAPHTHTEGERRIYQSFMEQASLSLEASFLLEQTERRARQLETSNEVSQIASSILDLDKLMPRVVNLIRDQFGYDHVQIFLMDAEDRYAVLRASTGEAGQQLLSINHKLEKGSQSVIGQVTLNARPTIALDTSDARVIHRPNPYLPLTRSEMALPIINKDVVVGALDVQSNRPNAFGDEDVRVLRTLAAQISVAIDNARLYERSEQRAEEMTFLFNVTASAANAETVEVALQSVVDMLLENYSNTLSAGVYLVDEQVEDPIEAFRASQRKRRDQPQDRFMRIVALAGSPQPLSEVEKVLVGTPDNLLGMAAADIYPQVVADVAGEPTYLPLVQGAASAIVVPLTSGEVIIGLLVLESDRQKNYREDSVRLLLTLSGSLSAIVQNGRLLEQIQKTNEELKTLDRLKSDFLANMSHELRTPLNSIIGFSRVMLKGIDGDLTEMQEQDLTTIYKSGQHLLSLINDILDQAKIAADKMDLDQKFFDIGAVAEAVKSIGTGLLKEKPVDIFLEMTSQLPLAFGDEFRTRQALLNIVSNAAKFTSDGSITISVYTFDDEERGTMIRIDVADTGIGIAEKDLPVLFEAFRQVDSSLTRTSEGTGLGLPITKSLIELQGGQMFVASEVNVGSTFSITVPTQPMAVIVDDDGQVVEQHPLDEAAANGAEPAAEAPTNGRSGDPRRTTNTMKPPPGIFNQKRQILLIMDEQQMVDQLRRQLQPEGFEVQVANHPMFAETMASGLRPTLVIMDVDFADGKGWEILEKLKDRDDTFDIPVVVVTMNEDSERAYQLGAYTFIQRPFLPNDVLKAVLEAEQDSNIDRILIIDDQEKDTRLLEQLLAEHGKYRVFAAHTGPEGISLVARRRPDLIILDLRMPQMDGFAVLEELRRQPEAAGIPVVVVTGETTLSTDEREQLAHLDIIYKTDLQHDYDAFIAKVKQQIANYHGDA